MPSSKVHDTKLMIFGFLEDPSNFMTALVTSLESCSLVECLINEGALMNNFSREGDHETMLHIRAICAPARSESSRVNDTVAMPVLIS